MIAQRYNSKRNRGQQGNCTCKRAFVRAILASSTEAIYWVGRPTFGDTFGLFGNDCTFISQIDSLSYIMSQIEY